MMAKSLIIPRPKTNFVQTFMMKNTRSIIAAIALLAVSAASAQKAKVVSAYNYNKAFERDKDCEDLKKGVESIESAINDEKTNTWAKTWYYGGNLYFNAALNQDADCSQQFEKPLDKTFDFYVKAMQYNIKSEDASNLDIESDQGMLKLLGLIYNKETDFEDPTYMRDILGQKFPYLANAFINTGVEAFQAEDYERALELSEKSVGVNAFMNRFDSLGMFNAALAAERLEKYDDALAYYSVLTAVGYGGPDLFMYMASIHERRGDTTKKMEVIRKGREAYPKDPNLITEELSYLISTGQTDKALENFDDAIAADPSNPSLYYNRGIIYDQLKDTEKAATDYKKALEVDPAFFDAAYNLGAMYYNIGVEWNNKASGYGLNETAKYKEATTKANDYFAKARPALEKAHELDPADQATMASLVKIYAIVGEDDLYLNMKKKLQGK